RSAKFAGGARHPPVVAVVDQRGKFASVAGDGVVQERELGQEPLHRGVRLLLDVVLQRRSRRHAGAEHLLDAKNLTLHATPPRYLRRSISIRAAINAALRIK